MRVNRKLAASFIRIGTSYARLLLLGVQLFQAVINLDSRQKCAGMTVDILCINIVNARFGNTALNQLNFAQTFHQIVMRGNGCWIVIWAITRDATR